MILTKGSGHFGCSLENRLSAEDEQEAAERPVRTLLPQPGKRDDSSGVLAVTVMASDRIMDAF